MSANENYANSYFHASHSYCALTVPSFSHSAADVLSNVVVEINAEVDRNKSTDATNYYYINAKEFNRARHRSLPGNGGGGRLH